MPKLQVTVVDLALPSKNGAGGKANYAERTVAAGRLLCDVKVWDCVHADIEGVRSRVHSHREL